MCGRFGLFAELDALAEQFNFDPSIMRDIYSPRWNIAPTAAALTVRHGCAASDSAKNEARLTRWGMTGAGNARARRPLFNARAETVDRLPSFRHAFANRRCLIPASGFYEWRKGESGGKTPVWFRREDDMRVAFAGIWARERAVGGEVETCSIITCEANALVAPVHHRMPVIVPLEAYDDWLNFNTDAATLLSLLQPVECSGMSWHPVSNEVNRSANDHPMLVEHAVREFQFDLTGGSDS